jgi:acyl-CoA synthetase (AMP-forming)/AMP-acid ligase II
MNLVALLVENARLYPERAALVDSRGGHDRVVSYGELARRVAAGAESLQDYGLKPGQVILVFQPVSIELYEFLLAAFHAGLRVMLADPSAGREFLGHCCRRLRPDAFFGSRKAQCLRLTVGALRQIPLAIGSDWFPGTKGWRTADGGIPPLDVGEHEPALITFTSGSTGAPKAAVRSHGFLLDQHAALAKALDFRDAEVDLITLPVFVLANLASGLTSVLAAHNLAQPAPSEIATVARQCANFQVTRCAASPAFFEALLASPSGIPTFEKLFTGGAPVFPDLLRRLTAALPNASIHSVFGSTEAEPIAHFAAADASEATAQLTRQGGGLCAGIPVPEIDLKILSDQWGHPLANLEFSELNALAVSPGEVGEIVVSGAHVLPGYLEGVGDEDTKIHVGGQVWHRTGDAGWMDRKGRLWLLGRCGEKLAAVPAVEGLPREALRYPSAIECALRERFPSIRMAALEWHNQRTLVVGKICAETELAAIQAQAAEFGIARVVSLKCLPLDRRHHAKIDYPALRECLAALPTSRNA